MSRFTFEGPSGYLTIQFLEWLSERPRTYGDAMDAWRTSCPRLSIWEDALSAGLVRLGHGSFRKSLSWDEVNFSFAAVPQLELRQKKCRTQDVMDQANRQR